MGSTEALQAFRQYDFDADARWRAYQLNLEMPPGADKAAVLQKFKAKWFKREIDPELDVASALSSGGGSTNKSSQPAPSEAKPAAPEPTPVHPNKAQPSQTPTPDSTPANQPLPQPSQLLDSLTGVLAPLISRLAPLRRRLPQLPGGPQARLAFMHLGLLVLCVLYIQPLLRLLSYRAWTYFLVLTIITHGYKVYLKGGAPRLRPFPDGIKTWLMHNASGTDFQYALMALTFLPHRPSALLGLPIATLAVYHVFAFAATHWQHTQLWQQYGARAHAWLISKQALVFNAACEVGVGFTLIAALLTPQRNLLLLFLYWNFVRMRYFSPDAAVYHQQVWRMIGEKTEPVFRAVPALRMPVSYLQRWFLAVRPAHA